MALDERSCPGCGLAMPIREGATYDGYYNTSPECWSLYSEVLGAEFSDALLYGQVHQLTVDAYALHHAGGVHPDKSIGIHLCGLHLVLECGLRPPEVPRHLQRLAAAVSPWPRFTPPPRLETTSVFDVALATSFEAHVEAVRRWSEGLWHAWAAYHDVAAQLVGRHLRLGEVGEAPARGT